MIKNKSKRDSVVKFTIVKSKRSWLKVYDPINISVNIYNRILWVKDRTVSAFWWLDHILSVKMIVYFQFLDRMLSIWGLKLSALGSYTINLRIVDFQTWSYTLRATHLKLITSYLFENSCISGSLLFIEIRL